MKIVNLGSLNIDHVYQVDHFVKPGETVASTHYETHIGGKGLNQSIALARAGAHVFHAGKIGKDGELLLDYLHKAGVDIGLIKICDLPTGHAIIQVNPDGENCIIVEGGANQSIDFSLINNVMDTCRQCDWLVLQNEINAIDTILKSADERNISVAYNPAPITAEVQRLPLELVSILFLNQIEGLSLSGEQTPQKILDHLLNTYPAIKIVLTLGEKGAIYADSHIRIEQRGFKVNPVDTTAAGDTFIGYFLALISTYANPNTSLKKACKAASLCVSKKGAAESIPTISEVEASLS